MSNLEAKKSKFDNDTQKQVIPLTGKRCPPGYRINKETGMCELFNPPTLKKTKTKFLINQILTQLLKNIAHIFYNFP